MRAGRQNKLYTIPPHPGEAVDRCSRAMGDCRARPDGQAGCQGALVPRDRSAGQAVHAPDNGLPAPLLELVLDRVPGHAEADGLASRDKAELPAQESRDPESGAVGIP